MAGQRMVAQLMEDPTSLDYQQELILVKGIIVVESLVSQAVVVDNNRCPRVDEVAMIVGGTMENRTAETTLFVAREAINIVLFLATKISLYDMAHAKLVVRLNRRVRRPQVS